MNDMILCSVKDAKKIIKHMNDDDMITLTVFSKKTFKHNKTERIKKKNGEELIDRADSIEYQDNEIFGRLSLYGVVKEEDVIHNLLFAQKQIAKLE